MYNRAMCRHPLLPLTFFFLIFGSLLTGCTRQANSAGWTPPPPGQVAQSTPDLPAAMVEISATPFQLPPTRDPAAPMLNPTPDAPHAIPTPPSVPENYMVQPGDTIGTISQKFGLSPDSIVQANGLPDANILSVGQELKLPNNPASAATSAFKIIPDSELVYGPFNTVFDIDAFVRQKNGYLANYVENVDGQGLTGAQVVERVAKDYSVNPRLLLALLDYRAGWVSNPNPDPASFDYPLGYVDGWHIGLYRQLAWASNALNYGFYGWQVNAIPRWILADGTIVAPDPTSNAGTAGVQYLFSQLDDINTWQNDVSLNGSFAKYVKLFGYPFDFSIEPLLPSYISQPKMVLPFQKGETWNFTGGPHGGWDSGSAWAALDFAPPGEGAGCTPSDYWVTAVADGRIVRAGNGAVVQDLDGDGYESTGWTVLYMHMAGNDRVAAGTFIHAGDKIGHPSCEGGLANATHLHLARRYNGMWIPADGNLPFNLEGWVSSGTGVEYDGYLTRNGKQVEAWDAYNAANQISR
jgi:LasA protease